MLPAMSSLLYDITLNKRTINDAFRNFYLLHRMPVDCHYDNEGARSEENLCETLLKSLKVSLSLIEMATDLGPYRLCCTYVKVVIQTV